MGKVLRHFFKRILAYINKDDVDYTLSESSFIKLPNIGSFTRIFKTKFGSHNAVSNNCFIYNCEIGDFSYLAENSSIVNTEIGKFCSIGRNVGICLGSHPAHTFVSTHPAFFSPAKQSGYTFAEESYFNESGSVLIGNDVWIGANVIIMNDLTIGDGAIIGAGTVVTRNVPPFAIVTGVPGNVLKYRFSEEDIKYLTEVKWWDRDIEFLKQNFKKFHDIEYLKDFLQK